MGMDGLDGLGLKTNLQHVTRVGAQNQRQTQCILASRMEGMWRHHVTCYEVKGNRERNVRQTIIDMAG